MLLSAKVIERLKCSNCNESLSVPPIFSNNLNGQNICGKCKQFCTGDKWFRDIPYEMATANVLFSCCYEESGCKEKVVPGYMENHQLKCKYIPVDCPYQDWKGPVHELFNHFQDRHLKHIIYEHHTNDSILQDLLPTPKLFHYLLVADEIYLINAYLKDNIMLFGLGCLRKDQNSKNCTLTYYTKGSSFTKMLKTNFWKNTLFYCKIEIGNDFSFSLSISNENKLAVNKVILNVLKCEGCAKAISPPVRKLSGKMLCRYCLVNQESQAEIEPNLTALAYLTAFNCSFCKSVIDPNRISAHEQACFSRNIVRPCCNMNITKLLFYPHLISIHHNSLIMDHLVTFDYKKPQNTNCLILLSDYIF